MAWNDPDKKREITPAVSNPVYLPPSPRQYGAVRPEDTNTADYTFPPVPDLISGPAKMVAGGLGAIPTAAGRAIEQIPAGVGKIIGAVPINPADYGVNKPLDLAAQGATEFAGGMRRLGTAARTGAMNLFGLKEAPVTSPSAPVASTLPAAAQPFAPPAAPAGGGSTREQFMGDIAATRVEPPPAVTSAAVPGRGISGTITMGDKTIEVPRSAPELGVSKPTRDYEAELDAVINKLMQPQYNTQGKRLTKTQEFGMASALKQAQVAGHYGLAGHEIQAGGAKATAEASKLATREEAALNRAERKRTAEERIRMDQRELDQRTAAGLETTALRSDIAKERSFQTALTKHGEDPIMGFNAGKGLFEMGFQGMHADRPEVQQAYLPFAARLEKAFGKTPTAKEKKIARDDWYKSMGWTP